jgi:hypothetical protein
VITSQFDRGPVILADGSSLAHHHSRLAPSRDAAGQSSTGAVHRADLLERALDEQAALDGFETMSPNGRPLGAQDFIAMVEMRLGRKVRPGKRGRKPRARRMDSIWGIHIMSP